VKNSIIVVEQLLNDNGEGYILKSNVHNPFPTGDKPELNVTEELDQKLASCYMQLIGILCWAVEFGCIDIFLEVSLLSQYQANPQLGHLKAIYHMFTYLKKYPDMGRLAYDSKCQDIDKHIFNPNVDWKEFYDQTEEELPPNMPEPRGHPVTMTAFVDANHTGNVITRCSHSGIIIFVQNAPIIWFSNR
jgi:hypothetical protein